MVACGSGSDGPVTPLRTWLDDEVVAWMFGVSSNFHCCSRSTDGVFGP